MSRRGSTSHLSPHNRGTWSCSPSCRWLHRRCRAAEGQRAMRRRPSGLTSSNDRARWRQAVRKVGELGWRKRNWRRVAGSLGPRLMATLVPAAYLGQSLPFNSMQGQRFHRHTSACLTNSCKIWAFLTFPIFQSLKPLLCLFSLQMRWVLPLRV